MDPESIIYGSLMTSSLCCAVIFGEQMLGGDINSPISTGALKIAALVMSAGVVISTVYLFKNL